MDTNTFQPTRWRPLRFCFKFDCKILGLLNQRFYASIKELFQGAAGDRRSLPGMIPACPRLAMRAGFVAGAQFLDGSPRAAYYSAMITRRFADTDIALPLIGQGTWGLGEDVCRASNEMDALRTGIDLGMTHIDTAEMYGSGATEKLVGRAITGQRERIFLVSKVLPENASYSGTLRACERSLKRLGTDWLDLYLLHWWSDRHPIRETMRALEELVRAGKVRHIGVSNLDGAQLKQAEQALERERLVCDQVCYHMKARGIEFDLISYCTSQQMALVGYSPFGSGNFVPERSKSRTVLAAIGARHGKSMRQVALNFLTRTRPLFTIPKAASIGHLRENADAVGWELTPDDLQAIDRAFPPPTRKTPLATL